MMHVAITFVKWNIASDFEYKRMAITLEIFARPLIYKFHLSLMHHLQSSSSQSP